MKKDKRKALTVRMPRELWSFISKKSIDMDTSINDLIIHKLNQFKENCENKLTKTDTVVS